ncbi:unnamed protein product [Kluyveromyces dobzhanskii CBS 2104]|uniref:WGS project CCBQ000000000 data, contig 00058 n=1 Tax=Kluyveromyces dobzhanskii CBS 2104 TaxID=1427455 RepID=A0A0A8LC04_9SACH|nr:unnamed protein product [Kluyveromyces dobzhanskii CBS 2104]
MKFSTIAAVALTTLSVVRAGKHYDEEDEDYDTPVLSSFKSDYEHKKTTECSSTESEHHSTKYDTTSTKSAPPSTKTKYLSSKLAETSSKESYPSSTTFVYNTTEHENSTHSKTVHKVTTDLFTKHVTETATSEVPCETTTEITPHYNSTTTYSSLPTAYSTYSQKNTTVVTIIDCPTTTEAENVTTKHSSAYETKSVTTHKLAPSNVTTPISFTDNGAGFLDTNIVGAGLAVIGAMLL